MNRKYLYKTQRFYIYCLFKNLAFSNISCCVLQITKKLNFAPTQTIFRNLQPINVNDSIMISKMTKGPRKCYSNNVDKIPVPNLHDFLKPVEPLQLTVSDDLVEQYVPVIQPRAPDYRSLYHQYIKIPGLV